MLLIHQKILKETIKNQLTESNKLKINKKDWLNFKKIRKYNWMNKFYINQSSWIHTFSSYYEILIPLLLIKLY